MSIPCTSMVISTQHHYFAQIDFDMHEFKLFFFSHALRYHVFGIEFLGYLVLLVKHGTVSNTVLVDFIPVYRKVRIFFMCINVTLTTVL